MSHRKHSRSLGGRNQLLSILLLAVVPLAACGEETASEENMGANPGAAMDTTPAGTPAPPSPAVIQDDQERMVTAELYEWGIDLSTQTVPAGEITFTALNTGTVEHALEVEGQGIEEETENIAPGESATLTVTLTPGSYVIYCPVMAEENHRENGMEATLVVQ